MSYCPPQARADIAVDLLAEEHLAAHHLQGSPPCQVGQPPGVRELCREGAANRGGVASHVRVTPSSRSAMAAVIGIPVSPSSHAHWPFGFSS